LLGFLFFFTDPASIVESALKVTPVTYLLVLSLYFIAHAINSAKWYLLLPEVPILTLVRSNFVGAFYSLILPGQVSGEIAKTWRLAKGTPIAEQVAASVFVDRVTGLIALLVLALIGASLSKSDVAGFILLPCAMAVAILSLSLFLMGVSAIQNFIQSTMKWVVEPVPLLRNQLPKALKLLDHLAYYSQAQLKLILAILLGTIFQAVVIAITVLFSHSLGANIGFLDLAWIVGIISLMIFLPISISGIGVRELGFVGILSFFEIDLSTAVTLSLLVFSLQIVGAAIGALFELTAKGKI
jgi:uncharacterized protein (TIRG00374 family)